MGIDNFVVLDSIYGKFIVARHCAFQAEALVKTGHTHIESELANIFVIVDTLPDHAVIIDGGTNIGFFMIPVAQRVRRRGICIIGFEPQRQLYGALSGSLTLNGLDNCFLHQQALGDQPGSVVLPDIDYGIPQDFGTVQVQPADTVEPAYRHDRTVPIVTIDSMNLERLDFLKLDVEGYECQALLGAEATLKRHRPWIWVEYFIVGADAIKTALNTLPDYDFYIADYQNMLCVPREQANRVNVSGLKKVD